MSGNVKRIILLQIICVCFLCLFASKKVIDENGEEYLEPTDYCKLTCEDGKKHVLCTHKPCYISKDCGEEALYEEFESIETNTMQTKINQRRVAINSNYHNFSYNGNYWFVNHDEELEFISQCVANLCMSPEQFCTRTEKFKVVTTTQKLFPYDKKDKASAILMALFDSLERDSRNLTESQFGVVDKSTKVSLLLASLRDKTTLFGCGRIYKRKKKDLQLNLVCSFAVGMERGKPLVVRVNPKDVCSCGCSNPLYHNLCGKLKKPEIFLKPFELARQPNPHDQSLKVLQARAAISTCNLLLFPLEIALFLARFLQ